MHNKWAQNKYIPFFAYIPLAVYAKTALARLNLYYFHFFVPVNGVEGKHFGNVGVIFGKRKQWRAMHRFFLQFLKIAVSCLKSVGICHNSPR